MRARLLFGVTWEDASCPSKALLPHVGPQYPQDGSHRLIVLKKTCCDREHECYWNDPQLGLKYTNGPEAMSHRRASVPCF